MASGPVMAAGEPVQLSMPLPRSPDTRVYMLLSTQTKAVILSLTTASPDELAAPKVMGSFVYALPNVGDALRSKGGPPDSWLTPAQRFDTRQPLSTTLFSHEPTVELTARLAKLVARRTQLPTYVTNSMSLSHGGMGATVDEEMKAFRAIADVVLGQLGNTRAATGNTAS